MSRFDQGLDCLCLWHLNLTFIMGFWNVSEVHVEDVGSIHYFVINNTRVCFCSRADCVAFHFAGERGVGS